MGKVIDYDKCMYIMPENVEAMSWSEAETFCERYTPSGTCADCAGTLLTIHDEALQNEIAGHVHQNFPGKQKYWIGLRNY